MLLGIKIEFMFLEYVNFGLYYIWKEIVVKIKFILIDIKKIVVIFFY